MARRQRTEKSRRRALTFHERWELESGDECGLGAHNSGSNWATDEDRQAAWFEHRDEMMAAAEERGRRLPWGYWRYEVGGEDPDEVAEEARIRREIDRIDGVDPDGAT